MADSSASRQWYEFRRHLAWTTLALWVLFAAAPVVALAKIWLSDREFVSSPMEIAVRAVLPATFFTAAAFFAVGILRTDDPGLSRSRAWRLVAGFAVGLIVFGVGAYVYSGGPSA